jgi:hypothetical protein
MLFVTAVRALPILLYATWQTRGLSPFIKYLGLLSLSNAPNLSTYYALRQRYATCQQMRYVVVVATRNPLCQNPANVPSRDRR